MEDFERYLDEIAAPTVADFEKNPTSVRLAFLACVALFHSIDYLAFPKSGRAFRQEFGTASPDFKMVDDVAHAFKHVVSGNRADPRLKAGDVVKRGGAFSAGAFSSAFDVGAVTLIDHPEVNLLETGKAGSEVLARIQTVMPKSARQC
jgi:hypothetical protein